MTDGQNTRDQITRGRRSKRTWSNCVLCIPFVLSGRPNECWLLTSGSCVITTWRLGLRAPLVARKNIYYAQFQHERWTRTSDNVWIIWLRHYFAFKNLPCFLFFCPVKSLDLNMQLTSQLVALLMNFYGFPYKPHGILWNSKDTPWIFHGIPWRFMENSIEIHGISWSSTKFHGIPWRYLV